MLRRTLLVDKADDALVVGVADAAAVDEHAAGAGAALVAASQQVQDCVAPSA
jgi:hypothetical protein